MRFWKQRRNMEPAVGYEQARELVREATEPDWTHGTYCLDDREIVETDQYYWFTVGAREFLMDGDAGYAPSGPDPVVDKQTGDLRWLPAHEIGWDPTLRRTPNPSPTCDGPVAPSLGRPPSYEEARELVREATEPGWSHGTYCLDDRNILENDEYYVFTVGAREFLIDGDQSYAIVGGTPIVYKADGRLDWIASPEAGMNESLRSRPNPHPTLRLSAE